MGSTAPATIATGRSEALRVAVTTDTWVARTSLGILAVGFVALAGTAAIALTAPSPAVLGASLALVGLVTGPLAGRRVRHTGPSPLAPPV